jgi:hypothetical protein
VDRERLSLGVTPGITCPEFIAALEQSHGSTQPGRAGTTGTNHESDEWHESGGEATDQHGFSRIDKRHVMAFLSIGAIRTTHSKRLIFAASFFGCGQKAMRATDETQIEHG